MLAIYPKKNSNGKIIITKQIDCFEINQKTKDITIYYMKNGKPKEKRFSYKDKLLIKDGKIIVDMRKILKEN